MNRKLELESAINEYLRHAEMYPSRDSWKLQESDDYVSVFGMSSFSNQDDPETYYFLAPQDSERKLLEEVDRLFDSQVSPATVRGSLQGAIDAIHENTTFVFPFETDDQEQQYHDKIYELLNFHYERRYDAIVPMYQLECADGVEFPLANAVLYVGGSHSLLADLVKDRANTLFEDDKKRIENCSFLKFLVTGDSQSILEQVEHESERALQVLRFIYPWFEKDGMPYNRAHGVSMWKQSARTILYQPKSATDHRCYWNFGIPNGIRGTLAISSKLLEDAQEFYGLDDINYHFQNHDLNLVSRRFCRAFRFYDIASQTSDTEVALTNFAICVDILLPKGKAKELTSYLTSLIEKGGIYEGAMTLNEQLSDPDTTEWPERVKLTVSDYKAFYIVRNKVVHGNSMTGTVSDIQLKKSRQIAKNAISAYAKLSRAFNWQTDKQAKIWFDNPSKPPK